MKKRYWLSFDLGLKGNYDKLFQWLDKMEANECGDFIATFVTTKSRIQLAKELVGIVDGNSRLYLVTPTEGGRFLVGNRKRAIWAGYAKGTGSVTDAS